jgi:hypothetical protein
MISTPFELVKINGAVMRVFVNPSSRDLRRAASVASNQELRVFIDMKYNVIAWEAASIQADMARVFAIDEVRLSDNWALRGGRLVTLVYGPDYRRLKGEALERATRVGAQKVNGWLDRVSKLRHNVSTGD